MMTDGTGVPSAGVTCTTAGHSLQWNGTTWACAPTSVGDDALDFDKFKEAMTLDASTDISVTGTNELSTTNIGTGASLRVNDQAGDTSPFVIDANGKLGVGTTSPVAKLDVVDEVKFGNSGATCDSTNEGQQRYSSTSKQMEFCDGSSWRPVSLGPYQITKVKSSVQFTHTTFWANVNEMNPTITLTAVGNRVNIRGSIRVGAWHEMNYSGIVLRIRRNGVTLTQADWIDMTMYEHDDWPGHEISGTINIDVWDTPSGTGPHTYRLQFRAEDADDEVEVGVFENSTLSLFEYAP